MKVCSCIVIYVDIARVRQTQCNINRLYCRPPLADYSPLLRQHIERLQLVVNRQLIVYVASFAARYTDCDTGRQQTLPSEQYV